MQQFTLNLQAFQKNIHRESSLSLINELLCTHMKKILVNINRIFFDKFIFLSQVGLNFFL